MGEVSILKAPIFVALDVDDIGQALHLAERVAPYVGGFKIGPRLTYRYGADLTKRLSRFAPVFVDNKYHDIPSTVLAAVRAAFESEASFVTVHASNGLACLKQLSELESSLNKIRYFKILVVTVLTSFADNNLPKNWRSDSVANHVQCFIDEVKSAGLSGVVCSPNEIELARKSSANLFLVTPGIRMPSDKADDQARVMSPQEALARGANALVVGRPILAASDPVAVIQSILSA